MLHKALIIFSALLLSSCANPKYDDTDSTKNNQLSCATKFSSGHCISYSWEKTPTDSEFGSFLFKTFRTNAADGTSISEDLPGNMAVVLWMPSMGHGSSPVTVEHLGAGSYRATNIFFTMRGNWEIRFQMRNGNNVNDQAILPITY